MKRELLACEVIKEELQTALEGTTNKYDVVWLEGGLHDRPEKLHDEIVRIVNESDSYDEIVLSYGMCGNALIGIKAVHCDILYPKVDDCISAMMCDNCKLAELRKCSMFTSRGWLSASHGKTEYERTLAKYGEKRTKIIFDMMYAHYSKLIYMRTEERIADENMAKANEEAALKGLSLEIEPAGIEIYKELLEAKEGEYVKRLKKGETLTYESFH